MNHLAPESPPVKCKLNILALPSYTSILFGLIVFVILGAILSTLSPESQICWPPLVLGIIFLTLRDYLNWPAREARQQQLQPLAAEIGEPLQKILADLSKQPVEAQPRLVVSPNEKVSKAFGTFRRSFISLNNYLAQCLAEDALKAGRARYVRAILAHELAHFLNRDVFLAGLSRSLLRVTALVALINFVVSLFGIFLIVDTQAEVAQRQFWADFSPIPQINLVPFHEYAVEQNPALMELLATGEGTNEAFSFIFYLWEAHWPLMVVPAVLLLLFWRQLLRVREYYADARTAALLQDAGAVLQTRVYLRVLLYKQAKRPPSLAPLRLRLTTAWYKVASYLPKLLPFRLSLLSYHPDPRLQQEALLVNPVIAFGRPWQMAAWTGFALFFLELILRSSLTVTFILQPGPHLSLVTAGVVFALWLLPCVCQGRPLIQLVRTITLMTALLIAIKVSLNVVDGLFIGLAALFGQLEVVGQRFDAWLIAIFGVPVEGFSPIIGYRVSWWQIVDWQIIRPLAYFVCFGFPVLMAQLVVDSWLKQRALTWYKLASRLRLVFWLITVTLNLVLVLTFIPVANRLFFPLVYPEWSWPMTLSVASGSLIAITALAAFLVSHQRWAHRCPQCSQGVPGGFTLGRCCPHCQTVLHPWLIAPY